MIKLTYHGPGGELDSRTVDAEAQDDAAIGAALRDLIRETSPHAGDLITITELDDFDDDEPGDRCTNPSGHEWNRSLGEADEARMAGDYANDNIRCIHCGADGDA